MIIKFLSDTTINRIAAGEVIERPASVVKELVENAIDAKATSIDILLEKSGKNLIKIIDDGVGMSPEDMEIAVQRHTTSKLDEDDLLNIHTFGFRGEALPSIGAISKLSITSKVRESAATGPQKAYQKKIIGGMAHDLTLAQANEGTIMEVRDLFFATPARLKFLRTDKTELNACIDVVKKIAIAHPHIAFSLSHEGKNIIKTKRQNADFIDNLKNRIQEVLGLEIIENSSLIHFENPTLSVIGFAGLPTFNRAASDDQYLFINNRPVKDKVLSNALRIAYKDYLSRDRHPVAVIFLKISPHLVDVNVHPAKSEVRFHDPNLIRGVLISSIKDALSLNSHKVSTHIATETLELFNKPNIASPNLMRHQFSNFADSEATGFKLQPTKSITRNTGLNDINRSNFLINTQPFAKNYDETESASYSAEASRFGRKTSGSFAEPRELGEQKRIPQSDTPNLEASKLYPLGAAKAQLHSTYIIAQTEDSLVIVDQHAAHERLGYEQIKEQIARAGLVKQRLLIPDIVELPDAKRADLLYSKKDDLSNLGLTLEKFGERSIIVTEIPSLIGNANIVQLVQDLADHLSDTGENIALLELIEHVTETYACHYSIRAGKALSIQEMNELLRQMERTPFSGQCNHGRPTYIELKIKDLEKLFGRL